MQKSLMAVTAAILLAGAGYLAYQFGQYPIHGLWGPAIGIGNSTEAVDQFDLGPELPGFDGYALRKRYIVAKPGGRIRIHDHTGRPAFSYIVAEPVTQHRSDLGEPIAMQPGDLSADNNMAHWWTNDGEGSARWYVVDIIQTGGPAGE